MSARVPGLDARLSAALALAKQGECFADIGADHGRLSAVALERGIGRHALVSDISEKALHKAEIRLKALGLSRQTTFAAADGLEALDALDGRRVDQIFAMGMGGDTLAGILTRGKERLCGAALIMSAQTDMALLRQTVCAIGYRVRRETMARDGERLYAIIRCEPALPGEQAYNERELLLGPVFLREKPPEWRLWLEKHGAHLRRGIAAMEAARQPKDAERLTRFRRELALLAPELETANEP